MLKSKKIVRFEIHFLQYFSYSKLGTEMPFEGDKWKD